MFNAHKIVNACRDRLPGLGPSVLRFCLPLSLIILSACASSQKKNSSSIGERPSTPLPNTEDIIIQDSSQPESIVQAAPSAPLPETQATARTASVWIEAIAGDAFMAVGFLQELEKHIDIVSINGIGFGCWAAMAWASENRGTYAEWQSFKWDNWDVLGSNLLNRVIGRSTADGFRTRLEGRMPLKTKSNFRIPMSCPYIFQDKNDFQDSSDLGLHEELWIQMRNTFFFPLMDIEKDERRSGFFRDPVSPLELLKFTPKDIKASEHVWFLLSGDALRREMRRTPQPPVQRGLIDDIRWVRVLMAPNEYSFVSQVKDLKKKRSLLLRGRKEGKQIFENPAVSTFLGFGTQLH